MVFSRDKFEALAHRQGQQISQQTDLIDKVRHIAGVETTIDMAMRVCMCSWRRA